MYYIVKKKILKCIEANIIFNSLADFTYHKNRITLMPKQNIKIMLKIQLLSLNISLH